MHSSRIRWLAVAVALASQPVFAHPGVHEHSFSAGALHPITGLDHILAMVAVGLWAFQRGGRARWVLPLVFVASMAAGGVLWFTGIPLPYVEHGILASILLLGALLAAAAKPGLSVAGPIIALCALFHGHAHGAELPTGGSATTYALGVVVSTALLHLSGLGIGLACERLKQTTFARVAGGATACCALALWMGAV